MTANSVYIQDVISDVVAKVSAEMTTYLKTVDSNITGVHFEFGTGLEIIETLQQKTNSTTGRNFDKYPLICLFLDVKEQFGTLPGIYSAISDLRMAIICGTQPTYKAKQRDEKNFKPILTPIYECFLRQLLAKRSVFTFDNQIIRHDATRNYYWGREGLYSKEGNIFNDKLDAIEITIKDLKIKDNYC